MKQLRTKNRSFFVFVYIILLASESLLAQSVTILDTLAYTQISNMTDINVTSRIRTSGDGSRVIFTGNFKMI